MKSSGRVTESNRRLPKRAVPRSCWHRLINTGPTVLVSSAHGSRRSVIAIAWSMPASIDPPLVVISVGRARASHGIIRASREFVINIPVESQLPLVRVAGTLSAREVDKFDGLGLTPEAGIKVGAPRVAECPGHLECRVVRTHRCGDHTLFVGEILGAYAARAFFEERLRIRRAARTLHHMGGEYFHLPGEIVRM